MSRTRKTTQQQRVNETKRKEIVQYIVNGMDAEAQEILEEYMFSGFMMGVQMGIDVSMLQLHRENKFSRSRGERFFKGANAILHDLVNELHGEYKNCGDDAVTEYHIDAELKQMMGEEWPEFNERYFSNTRLYCEAFDAIRKKIDLRNKQAVKFNEEQKKAMLEAAAKVKPGSPVYTRRFVK